MNYRLFIPKSAYNYNYSIEKVDNFGFLSIGAKVWINNKNYIIDDIINNFDNGTLDIILKLWSKE